MGAYSSRSKDSKDVVVFRSLRMFTDPSISHLYEDYDPAKPLDQYKGTDRDAGWRYRRIKTRGDSKQIVDLLVNPGYDLNAIRKRQDEGEDVTAEWEKATRTTWQGAKLEAMSVSTFGPYFTLPDDFTWADFHGDDKAKDAHKKHPLAGQTPPINPEWLQLMDEGLQNDVEVSMDLTHGGRAPDAEATFSA